jgi:hypothetical protein
MTAIDLFKLLESVVTYRNYMAHEFLAKHVNVRAHYPNSAKAELWNWSYWRFL